MDYYQSLNVRTNISFPNASEFEVVERKGKGHPDSLADAMAEEISCTYASYCLQNFRAVLHHNVDKLAIIGGHFRTDFGVSEFRKPVTVSLSGRMSTSFGDQEIDIWAIQEEAVRRVLRDRLRNFDPDSWLRFSRMTSNYSKYDAWFKPRTMDDLPEYASATASDSMIAVGYWPLSPLENLAIELERQVERCSDRSPAGACFGEDLKILAMRRGAEVEITMNVPLLSRQIATRSAYDESLAWLSLELQRRADELIGDTHRVRLNVNTSSGNPYGPKKIYLLGTGSCIECGEEGLVGRGNPVSGVISVYRPHSMEAAFGKNPVYHAGKVYAYFTKTIARAIAEWFECQASVIAITRHSDPLLQPASLIIDVSAERIDESAVTELVNDILNCTDYISESFIHAPSLLSNLVRLP